jgi:hypothetical protein
MGQIRLHVKATVRDRRSESTLYMPLTNRAHDPSWGDKRGIFPMRHDPLPAILTDLMRRVDGLASQRGHLSAPRIQDELDQIRHIARSFHLDTVEGLAATLDSALSLHGLGPIMLSYLDLMRDAIAEDMPQATILSMIPRTATFTPLPLRA